LVWPKYRRVAGGIAACLHIGLLVVLGPLGLNHRLGVLIWNGQFVMLAYFLFIVTPNTTAIFHKQDVAPEQISCEGLRYVTLRDWLGTLLVSIAIVLPVTERFGIWDHWPSWALYAPHSSRVRIELAQPSLDSLPKELVALMNYKSSDTAELAGWVSIPIDHWSLETLDTPIYPQARFQLGVAKSFASVVHSEFEIQLTVLGTANRIDGRRASKILEGRSECMREGDCYWLNTQPRVWTVEPRLD
jgi:hypothetical protein